MGQSKWALVCLFVASLGAGRSGAEEPKAGDPFAAEPNASSGEAAGSPRIQTVSSSDNERRAEERIDAALDQPLKSPLDFLETPLNTIATTIAEEYQIPIQFDERGLEAVAQSPDAEVTINVHNVTLRTALDLMMRQLDDVTYIVDREVLLITTEDEAATRLQTRVYQIDDLLPAPAGQSQRGAARPRFMPIVEVITRCVERDSWAINKTGEGEICVVDPGVMVVTQTQRVHAEIARLLATVRRVKAAIPRDAVAETADASHGGF